MKIYKTIIGIIALVCSVNVSAQTETADTLRSVKDTIVAAADTSKNVAGTVAAVADSSIAVS